MKFGSKVGSLFAAAVGFSMAAPAPASEFDRAMEPILAEYLKIQAALAADTTEGVADAVVAIEGLAQAIDPTASEGEDASSDRKIREEILAACEKLRKAEGIDALREDFSDLSKPVSRWVLRARPEGVSVMECPMADASWAQRGSEVLNPYYGSSMLNCGAAVVVGD